MFINRENQCTYYGVVCKLDYGEITGNTAANGGGVAIVTTQNYSNPSPFPSNVEPQNVTVEVSGASQNQQMLIRGNTASTNGGGIYVQAYPLTYNNTTSTVTTNVLDYTLIDNNTAATHGGGLFVQSGTVGILKNNENGSHKPTFTQNKATVSNGGGVYLYDGSVNMKGAVIGGSASTDGNTAGTSGGGIYVQTGSVSMLSTTISQNKATSGDGGGIFVNTGDVLINHLEQGTDHPSNISYNTAKLHGGGIYNDNGKVIVYGSFNENTDFPVQITYNKATTGSGGGIFCKGNLGNSEYDIRLRRINVSNNEALGTASQGSDIDLGCGGGIYLQNGKISVINGTIANNRANVGGGGVYTHSGNIDINPTQDERNASKIISNTAELNGGGLNTHQGYIRVFGNSEAEADRVKITGNIATTGSGGGIFCFGDNIDNEYIIVRHADLVGNKALNGGGTQTVLGNEVVSGCGGGMYLQKGKIHVTDVKIQSNTAKLNGGGINNHSGNITINGDYITDNIATTGDGGGVYIANGQINMFGGSIADNKADQGDGGGVFSGGGTFNIQKRDDNPKPIVTILDADVSRDGNDLIATIHYHVVDKGKNNGTSPAHGFYWGTTVPETPTGTPTYTYSAGNSTQNSIVYTGSVCDGSASGYKVVIRSGITAGQTYEVKAFYSYQSGSETVYGFSEKATFTAFSAAPTVVTGSWTNLARMSGSATKYQVEANGKVHDRGTSDLTAKGIRWKVAGGSYTNVPAPNDELALDFFTVTLADLNPATQYTIQAYATNGSGTAYGEEVSFTTPRDLPDMGENDVVVSNVTSSSADFSFTMPEGTTFGTSPSITSWGFVWSTDDDPELKPEHTIPVTTHDGLTFSVSTATAGLTLQPSTTYYVRAYASKSANEPAAFDIDNYNITTPVQFITKSDDGKPVVRAIRITDITQHAANIHGKLVDKGTSELTAYGIVWSWTNSEPTVGGTNCVNFAGSETLGNGSEFMVHMPGNADTLKPNKTYYVRTYATNSVGTAYSNNYNFTALPVTLPNVIVKEIQYDANDHTTVTVVCEIENTGGASINPYGIIYGQGSATGTSINGSNLNDNQFSVAITGLTAHQDYWVQAFATNSVGTHTCAKVSFSTNFDKPSVTLAQIGNVSFDPNTTQRNTAEGWYSVTPHSAATIDNVKTYGVCWSTFHSPTRTNSDVANTHFTDDSGADITGSAAVACSTNMAQRYPNMKYYVRAYASTEDPVDDPTNNSYSLANIVYSDEMSFVTLPAMQTTGVVATTGVTATLGGKIDSRDTEHHLRYYGVCWGTSANPVKGTNNYVERAIATANSSTFNYLLDATGLAVNTTYHYRAYSINENGESSYPNVVGNIAYGTDATFTTRPYNVALSANPAEGGSVSGSYASLESNSYTATATANEGYTFTNWKEGSEVVSTNAEYTFDVTGDRTLVANFTANSHTVSVTASPAEGGTVTGGGTYSYNASVTVTATANTSYTFVNWTDANGNEVSTEASYTFNMPNADVSLTANFSNGRSTSNNPTTNVSRPRDIYPAPAREPWDWDDMEEVVYTQMPKQDTASDALPDSIAMLLKQHQNREVLQPQAYPIIQNNTAEKGGGIFIDHNETAPAILVFAGGSSSTEKGQINNNYASEAGGGVYISQGAAMQMKGHCNVTQNHVPAEKKGGGIYLDGILNVGDSPDDLSSVHALQVTGNWVGGNINPETTASRNNVFLPTDAIVTTETVGSETVRKTQRVVTLLSDISGKDGNNQFYTNIGISVEHGFREVIFSPKDYEYANPDTREWLLKLMPESTGSGVLNSAIFDDSENYYALHVHPSDGVFDQDYIYFWSCWTTIVNLDPERTETGQQGHHHSPTNEHYYVDNEGVWHIKSKEGLAWFSSWVNGLNHNNDSEMPHTEAHPTAKAVVENDLDMSAYFWVPLGSVSSVTGTGQSVSFSGNSEYKGIFDGQGHIIKGLICTYMTGVLQYGLFGTVGNGGIVKNTFVDDYRFSTYKQNDDDAPTYYLGGIAAETKGNAIISNCEARGTMKTTFCETDKTCVGGLVGLMNGTTEVHSSMAMPEIVGTTTYPFTAENVGGLVGQINANNTLKNSFANMKIGDVVSTVNVGGLVGNNLGTVENCYARLQGYDPNNASTVPSNFGWFAGTNASSISYCYAPRVANDGSNDYSSFSYVKATSGSATLTGQDNYGLTERVSGKYGFKHRDHQMRFANNTYELALAAGKASANDTLIGGLQFTLNRWVNATNGNTSKYSTWSRTMASPINDDYPILEFADFNAVGSEDSIYMLYNADVNTMITAFNAVDATKPPTPSIYLYDVNPTTLNVSNDDNVMLAINEDIGITQNVPLKARVGVTIKNDRKGSNDYTDDPNWHLFSSAVANVPLGLKYNTSTEQNYVTNIVEQDSHPDAVWGDRTQFDPPKTTFYQSDATGESTYAPEKVGYFPTNTPYGRWRSWTPDEVGFFDFYDYSEVYYHWINYKREGSDSYQDHWHMDRDAGDGKHYKIEEYRNVTNLLAGKGYMMALSGESMMMADGILNNGDDLTVEVTNTPVGYNLPPNGHGSYAYDEPWRSLNLIGNPYQSFLDFKAFVDDETNADLLYSMNDTYSYAVRDDETWEYTYYTTTQSDNPVSGTRYIHPHQGFFVKVNDNGSLNFNNDMRAAGTSASFNSEFREEHLNYPLVNLLCYDANGKRTFTTVEINRPETGGGLKMKTLRTGNGLIYAHFEGQDFQTLFAPVGTQSVPVRFETTEDGVFTMR